MKHYAIILDTMEQKSVNIIKNSNNHAALPCFPLEKVISLKYSLHYYLSGNTCVLLSHYEF